MNNITEETRAVKLPQPIDKPYEEIVKERNGWEEEARRYCQNSDFWKGEFDKAKAALLLARQISRWLNWNDPTVFSDRHSIEAMTSDAIEKILAESGDNPQPSVPSKPFTP